MNSVGLVRIGKRVAYLRGNLQRDRDSANAADNFTPTRVLMMGWTGSRLHLVQRYAQIYQSLGFSVLFCCPSLQEIWLRSQARKRTTELLDLLADVHHFQENEPEHSAPRDRIPLIVHAASGAPYVLAQALARDHRFNIKGIVWDCSPAPFTAGAVIAATRQMYQSNDCTTLQYLALTCGGVTAASLLAPGIRRDFFDAMRTPSLRSVPSQFIFFEKDPVSPASYIRDFARQCEDQGAPVYLQSFPEADHVRLLKYHPQEYINTISQFVKRSEDQS